MKEYMALEERLWIVSFADILNEHAAEGWHVIWIGQYPAHMDPYPAMQAILERDVDELQNT